MKKLIIAIMLVFGVVGAYAETSEITTSQHYVDTNAATRQDAAPANNANSVMTYDSVSPDGIGAKAIYDTTAAYGEQKSALVTAATANVAIQNGINSEFVCANPPKCNLWDLKGFYSTSLPAGYTELEYIESTGTQCINTGKKYTSNNFEITWDAVDTTTEAGSTLFAATAVEPWSGGLYGYAAYRTYWIGNSGNQFLGYNGSLLGQRHTWKLVSQDADHSVSLSRDNNFVSSAYFTGDVNKTHNIYLFCGGWVDNDNSRLTQFAKWRLYNWQFRDNGVLVFNGIPAKRNSDGISGMYDIVSGTFFSNVATSGDAFIAGPVASYVPQNQ